MKKRNLIIDIEKCEDCNNCFLSCKDEHVENEFQGYTAPQPKHGHRWINILRKERGKFPLIDVAYLPVPCMHCAEAPCITKSEEGAVYRRSDGIVIIDPQKAAGRVDIMKSCPYGTIWWNEEKQLPQKCTLCAHLLDNGWKEPRCVQSCPTGALRIISVSDKQMQQMVVAEKLEVYHPQHQTKPRVYYKNLHLFTRCFVGGSVAVKKEGITDCLEGATVNLIDSAENKISETSTDNFGDFKFDDLAENSGKYLLEITHSDYAAKTMEVELKTSLNVGTIMLQVTI